MKMITHIFSLVLLVIVSGNAFAQQQVGPVIDDIHRRNNPNHPGYVGNNAVAPVQPREAWQNKYGAIAVDFSAGRSGAAEDENSLRAAKRDALQRCGTRDCKVIAWAKNGCVAAVHGGGITGIASGETEELAIRNAVNQCAANNGARCEVNYSYCSLPVRIR